MTSNKDDQVLPENATPIWLNEEYFRDILSQSFSNYEIQKFSVEDALAPGENYLSKLYRIKIDLKLPDETTKNLSYIIKVAPEPEDKQEIDIIEDMGLFVKEIQMYEKYIPKFENLYEKFGVNIKFAPKQYKLTPDILIMEDLKSEGFRNLNRQKGFDLKQSEAILEKLAKFHAASVCIAEEEGPYPDRFFEGVYPDRLKEFFNNAQENVPQIFVECMHQWDCCNEYIDKMEIFLQNAYELSAKALKYNPNVFNVLNHGDLWSNNIMFKYDENNQEFIDLQFVDLQLCKWGSPAQDLNYFIISSCSTDIKVKHFDYLIKYYHDQLISNLKLLKYSKPLPKLRDLHCEMFKCGTYAVTSSSNVMAVALLEPCENATLDNFLDNDEGGNKFRKQMYSSPYFIEAMKELLPLFDNRGFLDP